MSIILRGFATAIIASLALSACGGSGGGTGNTNTSATGTGGTATLIGLAVGGAPIVGTVSARDSRGTTFGPVTISPSGAYSLNLAAGNAPFILQATGTVAGKAATYYSSASAVSGVVNITPLTHIIVAQAAQNAPDKLFTNCTATTCTQPSAAAISTAQTNVQASLANLLALFNAQGTDLMAGKFVAGAVVGQSPIDVLLDSITVAPVVGGAPSSFNITANANTGLPANTVLTTLPATAAATPLVINPALTPTVIGAINVAQSALIGIQAQLTTLQNIFAAALPPAANDPALVALLDPTFLADGLNGTAFLTKISHGITFGAPLSIPSPDGALPNDATHQWFSTRATIPSIGGFPPVLWRMLVIKNAAGTWLLAGNQRQVAVNLTFNTSQTIYPPSGIPAILNASGVAIRTGTPANTPPLFSTTLLANVSLPALLPAASDAALIAKGVNSVTVSGPGIIGAASIFSSVVPATPVGALPGSKPLNICPPSGLPGAIITNCWNPTILPTPGVYTFTVTGTTFSYVYHETLNAISSANFPVQNTPLNQSTFTSGAIIPISWTAPADQSLIHFYAASWDWAGTPAPVAGVVGITATSLTLPKFAGTVRQVYLEGSTLDSMGNTYLTAYAY